MNKKWLNIRHDGYVDTDTALNLRNAALFTENGLDNNDAIYTCVHCGRKVCLDDSMSHRGNFMTCWGCFCRKFMGALPVWERAYTAWRYKNV